MGMSVSSRKHEALTYNAQAAYESDVPRDVPVVMEELGERFGVEAFGDSCPLLLHTCT